MVLQEQIDNILAVIEKFKENKSFKIQDIETEYSQNCKYLFQVSESSESLKSSLISTVSKDGNREAIEASIELIKNWMVNGNIVRIVGAGRAKLAASIPANRLSHGGAKVYVQDDIIPMPHSIKGGGVIAVTASGETTEVLDIINKLNKSEKRIEIIIIAGKKLEINKEICSSNNNKIITIVEIEHFLKALADTGEQVINLLLDNMVVSAGKRAGYDETKWRLGHEDLGATGPYDISKSDEKTIKNINTREKDDDFNQILNKNVYDSKDIYILWMMNTTEYCKKNKKELIDINNNLNHRLAEKDINFEKSLKKVIDQIKSQKIPIDFLVVLGLVRSLYFDEELLAHLWDSLGNGHTRLFLKSIKIIKGLFEENKFFKEQKNKRETIKFKEIIHFHLYTKAKDVFKKDRILYIHYFIGEYFQRLFVESNNDGNKYDALDNFIYHSLNAGNYNSAFKYLFISSILEKLHDNGKVEYIKNGMVLMRKYNEFKLKRIKLEFSQNPSDVELKNELDNLAIQNIKIKIEEARIYKDITQHKSSIDILREIKKFSREHEGIDIEKHKKMLNTIKSENFHYLGIAYSQIGHADNCKDSYYNGIVEANGFFSPLDILSIGYYSYELKFFDIENAKKVARESVLLCDQLLAQYNCDEYLDDEFKRDKQEEINLIKLKNSCNLASILAFSNNLDESKKLSDSIIKALDEDNNNNFIFNRLLARTKVNYLVTLVGLYKEKKEPQLENEIKNIYKTIRELYDKHDEKNIRRKLMADAYYNIFHYHNGVKYDELKVELLHIINEHSKEKVNAIRETIYEILTYMWLYVNNDNPLTSEFDKFITNIKENKFDKFHDYKILQKSDLAYCIIKEYIDEFNKNQLCVFGKFWDENYKIVLLEKQKGKY